MHDGWRSYRTFDVTHALCNVHHLRELKGIGETEGQEWARAMFDLLIDAKKMVDDVRSTGRSGLTEASVSDIHRRYRMTVKVGFAANPQSENLRRQTRARNLLDRLHEHEADVLRFTTDFTVPFGNNQAERDIRMVKLRQKISGCLRTLRGAEIFAILRSYLSTARKNDMGTIKALTELFQGTPWIPGMPHTIS